MKFLQHIQQYTKSLFVLLLLLGISISCLSFASPQAFAQAYGSGTYNGGSYNVGDANSGGGSNGGGSSNGGSSSSSSTCTAMVPVAPPDLFEIDVKGTNATLFLAPPPQPYTNYQISFGNGTKDEGYNVTFPMWNATGALTYTVQSLQPSSQYTFKVRALNNCMPGKWSGDVSITSGKTKGTTITKYYPSKTQTLSYKPNTTVTQRIPNPSITPAPGKPGSFVPTPVPYVKPTTKTNAAVSSPSIWDNVVHFFTHLF